MSGLWRHLIPQHDSRIQSRLGNSNIHHPQRSEFSSLMLKAEKDVTCFVNGTLRFRSAFFAQAVIAEGIHSQVSLIPGEAYTISGAQRPLLEVQRTARTLNPCKHVYRSVWRSCLATSMFFTSCAVWISTNPRCSERRVALLCKGTCNYSR